MFKYRVSALSLQRTRKTQDIEGVTRMVLGT